MPIYEYRCTDCGNKFEKLVRRSGGVAEKVECPSCGKNHLEEQYSTFAARSNGASKSAAEMPSCPSGMCSNPGMCGNFSQN